MVHRVHMRTLFLHFVMRYSYFRGKLKNKIIALTKFLNTAQISRLYVVAFVNL